MFHRNRALPLLGWLGLGIAACGGDSGGAMAPGQDLGSPPSVCLHETRADTYAAGLSKPSQQGAFTVELLRSDPSPPQLGTNTWTIQVRDQAGGVRGDLAITALPWMPDHNHGTSVKASVTPTATSGEYAVAPLYLFMAGLWQTTLHLEPPGQAMDQVVFSFCIDSQ